MNNEEKKYLDLLIQNKEVFIITKNECPLCNQLKDLFNTLEVEYTTYLYEETEEEINNNYPFKTAMKNATQGKQFPFCYINSIYVGGYKQVHQNLITGKLKEQLNEIGLDYEEDF